MVVLCIQGGRWGAIGSHSPLLSWPFGGHIQWILPAGGFMLLWAATFLLCCLLLFTLPRSLSPITIAGLILFLALLCRLALLPHPPSSDIFRYLWEGRLVHAGINPYLHAPADPFLSHLAASDALHAKINHPNFTSIYPPFFLYITALVATVGGGVYGLKSVVVFVDLATVALLLRLLWVRGLNLRWVGLYAFNPVILYAFAGQGHLDVFQNFFILLAFYCYERRRWGWMFLALGLAVQSKYVAVLVFPFFVRRDNLLYVSLMVIAIVAPFLPLINGGLGPFFHSLIVFSQKFAFNGSVHGLLRLALGGISPATLACQVIFGITLLWSWVALHPGRSLIFKGDPMPGCFFVYSALLLLSPTVHFWYLSWGIIFLPVFPNAAWIALSFTAGAYFAAPGNQLLFGRFYLPPIYQAILWGVPWLFFINFLRRCPIHFRTARVCRPVRTVSVVVPTLNEAHYIHACVTRLNQDPAVMEVIVVDGGSKDYTVADAGRAGARVLIHAKALEDRGGRGGQITRGLTAAHGDVVAVVHADTLVERYGFSKMIDLLNRRPVVIGGALGSVFDAPGWKYRALELANDMRTLTTGISFGDQVQFFRREPVVSQNLYPDQPLMEDVELSLRLKRIGKLVYHFGVCRVSARKWQRAGLGRAWMVVGLLIRYLRQRLRGTPDTASMYRQYYRP